MRRLINALGWFAIGAIGALALAGVFILGALAAPALGYPIDFKIVDILLPIGKTPTPSPTNIVLTFPTPTPFHPGDELLLISSIATASNPLSPDEDPVVFSETPSPTITTTPQTATMAFSPTPTTTSSSTPTPSATPSLTKTNTYIPTIDPETCDPPEGWAEYTVRSGDTLGKIADAFDTTVSALQAANCLVDLNFIYVGQMLYVPSPYTVTPQATSTETKTPQPSYTPLPSNTPRPSSTATRTYTPGPTNTASHTPTIGPSPTASDTPTPSNTPLPTNTPTPTNTPQPPTATSEPPAGTPTVDLSGCVYANNSWMETEVLTLINQERANVGLPPLTMNWSLRQAAREHSADMACNNFVSHTGSNGTSAYDRITAYGYYPSWWGENIYMGWNTSPAAVVNWWMNSTPHRNNILHQYYIHIGVGHAYYNNRNAYTLNFGRP